MKPSYALALASCFVVTGACTTVNVLPSTEEIDEVPVGVESDAEPTVDSSSEGDGGLDGRRVDADADGSDAVDACVIHATTAVSIRANLDSTATPPALPWDVDSPEATSNVSLSFQVYSPFGSLAWIAIYWQNTGPGTWTYHVVASSVDVGMGPGDDYELVTGDLTFDGDGALESDVVTAGGGPVRFNGAPPQTIAYNFGSPRSIGGSGTDGITQFNTPNAEFSLSLNGDNCLPDASAP
jgi:Flagellar basal body protein FlaE